MRYLFILSFTSKLSSETTKIVGMVVDSNDYFLIKVDNEYVILYTENHYQIGDILEIKGNLKEITSSVIPLCFNYQKYCEQKKIYYQIYSNNISLVNHQFHYKSISEMIFHFLDDNIDQDINMYYKSLIFGNNDDLLIKEDLQKLGISHLFAISGLHIGLIVLVLKRFIKDKYLCFLLGIYLVLTSFALSVVRAIMMYFIKTFFKWKKLQYSSLDILSIVFIFLMIINPYFVYQIGFALSFIVTFGLIVSSKLNIIKIAFLAPLITLPLTINLTNEINLLTFILNIIVVSFFSFIFLPLTFITFILPLKKIYAYVVYTFNQTIEWLSRIDLFTLKCGDFNCYEIIIYYLFFYLLMAKKKWYYLMFFIFLMFNKNCFLLTSNVYVFDVGQGDSSLIETPKSKIMIDAYGYSYQFLAKKGIRHLDYLIITHGHNDHYEKIREVKENVSINYLVLSKYADNREVLKLLPNEKVIYVKQNDILKTNDLCLEVFSPDIHYENENNNSIVLKWEINDYRFLFMGDAEKEVEEKLILKYQEALDIDVLKTGHHGSDTSTTPKFLDLTTPLDAIISLKADNKYGFPSESVIQDLEKRGIKIHLTCERKTYHLIFFLSKVYDRSYNMV